MKIGKIVDLSMPIGSATIVYPGGPVPLLTPAATIEHDGYHELHLQMRSHTGTHVDAPYHFDAAGSRVDELQLHLFVGSGVVVDATRLAPRTRIDWPVLSPYVPQLGHGVIVLLHTGSRWRAGASAYVDHPFLDADACRRLLDLGVRTICTDALSVDETLGPGQAGESYPVHHLAGLRPIPSGI